MKDLFAKITDWYNGLKPQARHSLNGGLIGLVIALFIWWVIS